MPTTRLPIKASVKNLKVIRKSLSNQTWQVGITSNFSDAGNDCKSRSMNLMTPTLNEMNEIMRHLNVSIFWTGFTRINQTHFHETITDRYASCGSNEWASSKGKKR